MVNRYALNSVPKTAADSLGQIKAGHSGTELRKLKRLWLRRAGLAHGQKAKGGVYRQMDSAWRNRAAQ